MSKGKESSGGGSLVFVAKTNQFRRFPRELYNLERGALPGNLEPKSLIRLGLESVGGDEQVGIIVDAIRQSITKGDIEAILLADLEFDQGYLNNGQLGRVLDEVAAMIAQSLDQSFTPARIAIVSTMFNGNYKPVLDDFLNKKGSSVQALPLGSEMILSVQTAIREARASFSPPTNR